MTPAPEDRKIPVFSVVGGLALALTLILNTIVGVLLIKTRESAGDYATCTAQWQQQFGSAYRARLAASQDVDEALDAVILAVAHQDRKAFQTSLARYVALRDRQERERVKNPLPPLPEQLCGDPEEVRR